MPLDNGDLKATPSKGVKTIVVTWLVGMVVVVVVGLRYIHINVQWLFLVHVKGGRWHIIPQLAVYTTYIPLIILAFWGAPYATTFYGNQKQPLICMYYYTVYDNSLLDSLPVLWHPFPSMMKNQNPHIGSRYPTLGLPTLWSFREDKERAARAPEGRVQRFACQIALVHTELQKFDR